MLNFVDLVKYKSDKNDNESFKESILINLIFTVGIFLFLYAINNLLINHKYGFWLMILSCIAEFTLVSLFFKKKISYAYTVNLAILLGTIPLISDIFYTNGISSPTLPWIIIAPTVSFLLLEKSVSTYFWIILSIFTILFFGVLNIEGIVFENKINPDYFAFYHLSSYIGLVFMLVIIANIFENKKNRIFNELQQKQSELQNSETRFRTMFEKAPLGIGLTNSITGAISEMNPRYEEIVGRNENELKHSNWMSITHPDDIQADLHNMALMNAGEIQGFKMEKRYIKPDGAIVWVDVAITPIITDDKNNPYHLCMLEDITDKRQAEIIVRNRELLIQQNVLMGLSLIPSKMEFEDKIKTILVKSAESLNCEYTSFWSIDKEGLSTNSFYKLSDNTFVDGKSYTKNDCPVYFSEIEKNQNIVVNNVYEHSAVTEFTPYFKENNIFSLLDIPVRKGNEIIGIFSFEHSDSVRNWTRSEEVFARSISDFIILAYESEELKQAKEKLKINEERWKFAIQGSNDGLWDWNVETSEVYRSPRWYEMLGFNSTEINNNLEEWLNRIHSDDIEQVNIELQEHFSNNNKSYTTEHRILCKDGTYKWVLDRGKIIERNNEGKPLRIVGTTTDITKRKRAEEELLQSEGKLQAIFKGSNDAILLLTEKGFFDCNPKALEMFGLKDMQELINVHPSEVSPKFQRDGQSSITKADEMIQIALKNGVNRFEWMHKRKNGVVFPAEVLLSAFEYGGEIVIQSTVQDITERKKAEETIKQNEEKYRSLIENSPEIILIVNKDEKVEFSNFANTRYGADEIIGHDLYEFVFEQHHEMIREAHRKVFDGEKSQSYETEGKNANGDKIWYLTHVGPKYFNNEVVGLVLFIKNITDRRIDEEKIKQSLHEKEVLLKEVHHRVKNNLQIISSILNLQSTSVSDKQTLDLLKNSQDRIRSMSLIHELLYQTKDFSTINFLEYIRSISTNLFQSYNQNKNIDLVLELQPVALDLDLAIPCGLIINELITNSLKYAFEITGSGEVKIVLIQLEDEVLLTIEDNGKGFPTTIDFRDTESLGMQLVVSLVDQIDGEIKLESVSGTKYELRFKNVLTGAERLN